jgi:ZIP family zinc transporter
LANHPSLVAGIFAFSAGGILFLVFNDVAPLAHREGHWAPTLGAIAGFMVGLAGQRLVGV